MWRVPSPLIAGAQSSIVQTIDSDVQIGNLYTYLGSPPQQVDVVITVDGADVGEVIIPNTFAAGSTFQFIAINGGRYLGLGGDGGDGGPDFGSTGEAGSPGANGGHAITNQGTYPVSIDVDNGFLFGGGGGGGGGSYTDTGTGGDAGCGGGGGQGYTGGSGGTAGSFTGLPQPTNGSDGSRSSQGFGGAGLTAETSDGGDGGSWGLGGRSGRSSNMISGLGAAANFFYYGGLGGNAGRAYSGGNLTLSGSLTEAQLRTAGRILGEVGPDYLTVPSFSINVNGFDVQPTNDNLGIAFQSTGSTLVINTTQSPPPSPSTQYYLTGGSGTGANYQVRVRALTGDADPSYWDSGGLTQGTWYTISSIRQWWENFTSGGSKASLFELRRSDIPGVGADDVMASFYVKVVMESEP